MDTFTTFLLASGALTMDDYRKAAAVLRENGQQGAAMILDSVASLRRDLTAPKPLMFEYREVRPINPSEPTRRFFSTIEQDETGRYSVVKGASLVTVTAVEGGWKVRFGGGEYHPEVFGNGKAAMDWAAQTLRRPGWDFVSTFRAFRAAAERAAA